ncbi:MAG: hypothetical protein ISN29_09600 [Gammaproteobacteria bacterium AqS3]|nr:hypothetical protein [Gammaproteobacteria bacterium AqS3]
MNAARNILHQAPLVRKKPESYLKACYAASFDRERFVIRVRHRLSESNLVHQLVKAGKAQYGCEIISPRTFYREFFPVQPEDGVQQVLKIDEADIALDDTILHPIIVSTDEDNIEVCKGHGLHEFFTGKFIEVLPGTILADGGYFGLIHEVGKMFSKYEDSSLPEGTYKLEQVHDPALHFSIGLAPDLHANFENISPEKRQIFLTGILANALEMLGRSCLKEDEIDEEFLEKHPRARKLLESLGENIEAVLDEIKNGGAAKIASHYRTIKMTPQK